MVAWLRGSSKHQHPLLLEGVWICQQQKGDLPSTSPVLDTPPTEHKRVCVTTWLFINIYIKLLFFTFTCVYVSVYLYIHVSHTFTIHATST